MKINRSKTVILLSILLCVSAAVVCVISISVTYKTTRINEITKWSNEHLSIIDEGLNATLLTSATTTACDRLGYEIVQVCSLEVYRVYAIDNVDAATAILTANLKDDEWQVHSSGAPAYFLNVPSGGVELAIGLARRNINATKDARDDDQILRITALKAAPREQQGYFYNTGIRYDENLNKTFTDAISSGKKLLIISTSNSFPYIF